MAYKILDKHGSDSIVIADSVVMHIYENMIIEEDGYVKFFAFGKCDVVDKGKNYSTTFKLANIITSIPSEIRYSEGKEVELVFLKGDIFIQGDTIISDITNIELLFKMLSTGNLPDGIPIMDYLDIFFENIESNGGLNMNDADLEIVMSEMPRSDADFNIPSRLKVLDKYRFGSFRALVAAISTHTSMFYEDPLSMMANGISRKDAGVEVPSEKYTKL